MKGLGLKRIKETEHYATESPLTGAGGSFGF